MYSITHLSLRCTEKARSVSPKFEPDIDRDTISSSSSKTTSFGKISRYKVVKTADELSEL